MQNILKFNRNVKTFQKLTGSNDYKYCYFDSDNSILYHEITYDNCGTKEDLILSMSYFITLIEKYHPKSLVIKILKTPDYFELELEHFFKVALYKRIDDLKIKKVAFFIPDEFYLSELKKYEQNNSLKIKFFGDIEEAKQWAIT